MRLPSKTRRAIAIAILIAAAGMIVYGAFFQKARVTADPSDPPESEYTLQGMDLFSKARIDALTREQGKLIDTRPPRPVVDAPTQPAVADAEPDTDQPETNTESPTQGSGEAKPATAAAEEPETRCPT